MLIRYGGLIANYHRGFSPNSRLVIWLSGMPSPPSDTTDKDVAHFLACGYDIVLPEYYGSMRSDGEFTPDNCLKTGIDTYNFFNQGGTTADCRSNQEVIIPPYTEIVVIGNSFGAAFAVRVPYILPQVSKIGLISGAWKYADMNLLGYPEEDYQELERVLHSGGYQNLYRNATGGDRDAFYQDQRGQPYAQIVQELSQKSVFIAHGDADDCVAAQRSRDLYQALRTSNPGGNHHYCEVRGGGHGGITKQIAVVELCRWLIGRNNDLNYNYHIINE